MSFNPVPWVANSTHGGKVVGSYLVSSKIIDSKNSVKEMPGLIPKFGLKDNK